MLNTWSIKLVRDNGPQITMECKGIEVGTGKTEWGAVESEQYFVIKLGREVGREVGRRKMENLYF
jgi:hypothetical protein